MTATETGKNPPRLRGAVSLSRAALALVLLAPALTVGCFQRGDVELVLVDPRPESWSPGSLLRQAVAAADADLNATRVLEFGGTFDEDGILRIFKLRVYTHRLDDGTPFYLDYFVGRDYEPQRDAVVFRGFSHDELGIGQRPDPAKEWDVTPEMIEVLDRVDFAAAFANETRVLGSVPIVAEFTVGADCEPRPAAEGTWRVYNATESGVEFSGAAYSLECFTRPHLPPTLLVNLHTPCYRGPQCPQATVHQFLVDYP